jgi:hypothetical protein
MLILSEPTLTFRGEDYKEFLRKHDNGLNLLPDFLEDPMTIPEDIHSKKSIPRNCPFLMIS